MELLNDFTKKPLKWSKCSVGEHKGRKLVMPKKKNKKKDERDERKGQERAGEERDNDIVNPGGVRPSRRRDGEIDITPVDSYTGEPLPPEPEGDIPLEDMEVESFASETDIIPLEEDNAMDYLISDAAADQEPMQDIIDDYTDDQDTIDEFAERQGLSNGAGELVKKLLDHHFQGPQLSGGDIDAAWDSSIVSGEESVGGTSPTPDQDVVHELGEAMGISYDDDEELATADKLDERDENRWELDPRSADDEDETADDEFENQHFDDF
jgi:hypothetical protein